MPVGNLSGASVQATGEKKQHEVYVFIRWLQFFP